MVNTNELIKSIKTFGEEAAEHVQSWDDGLISDKEFRNIITIKLHKLLQQAMEE